VPETAPSPIRILLVDDHPLLREGVSSMLEDRADMIVVGEASDGAEAVIRYRELQPDVTLMDLQMPVMNGVEAIAAIKAEFPEARFLVLTTYAGDVQAVRALKAGATGYLLKSSLRTEMLDAIHSVHRGRRHLHGDVAAEIALHVLDEGLSEREIQVLGMVAAGNANKEIARALRLSEETVKGHLKNIFAKLHVTDRTEAVTVAARRGIIDL
jgi:DNA-binding NarL/FixJ family response regulator